MKGFYYIANHYYGKVVYTIFKDDSAVGSVEFEETEHGKMITPFGEFITKLNDIHKELNGDRGGSVR